MQVCGDQVSASLSLPSLCSAGATPRRVPPPGCPPTPPAPTLLLGLCPVASGWSGASSRSLLSALLCYQLCRQTPVPDRDSQPPLSPMRLSVGTSSAVGCLRHSLCWVLHLLPPPPSLQPSISSLSPRQYVLEAESGSGYYEETSALLVFTGVKHPDVF